MPCKSSESGGDLDEEIIECDEPSRLSLLQNIPVEEFHGLIPSIIGANIGDFRRVCTCRSDIERLNGISFLA